MRHQILTREGLIEHREDYDEKIIFIANMLTGAFFIGGVAYGVIGWQSRRFLFMVMGAIAGITCVMMALTMIGFFIVPFIWIGFVYLNSTSGQKAIKQYHGYIKAGIQPPWEHEFSF